MESLLERFLSYVRMDTESVPGAKQFPSSEKQKDFLLLLAEELREMGAKEVSMDENSYVFATIPATIENAPTLGFIAHVDTSNAVSGKNVNPRVIREYTGEEIPLNKEYTLSPKEYPELLHYVGQDLVVTDGNTLLGADDKAGIAEIMEMARTLLEHPEIPHGKVRIGFTPDEEIGRGVDYFDVQRFGAQFAYTVDGGELGELEYENFNAASAELTIHGKSIHPGSAKGRMKNAILMAMEFHAMLPAMESPALTEGYQGFYHLDTFSGTVDKAQASYIIRDHDRAKFEEKKELFLRACNLLNQKYGTGSFVVEMRDSYYNMKEQIQPHWHLIEHAKSAMEELGITPKIQPIRGGTDGSRLSFMGLPCPNLCTGGHNAHGRFEYVCVQSMEKIVQLLIKIVECYAKK